MWACGDNGIQWEANATIRNNIVLGAGGAALASQPHQEDGPNEIVIVHDTLINDGDALAVRNPNGPVTVANNALYSMGRAFFANGELGRITATGNGGQGSTSVGSLVAGAIEADLVGATFSGALPQDLRLADGGALAAAGASAHVSARDFAGTDRMGVADIGAYGAATMGGWTIAEAFKPAADPTAEGDGGVPTEHAGTPGGDGGGPSDDGSPAASDGGLSADDTGGCGGRTSGAAPNAGWLLAALVLVFRRRR